MKEKFAALRKIYAEISSINSALSLLHWDQQVYMPPGGAAARAEVLGDLEAMAHSRLVSRETAALIEDLSGWALDLPYDSFEASFMRAAKREYDKAVKLPVEFVSEFSREVSAAISVWTEAKRKSDYSLFAPHLGKIISLNRRKASYLGGGVYDALLDLFEPGMKKSDLEPIFRELKGGIVPLLAGIKEKKREDKSGIFGGGFGKEAQRLLADRLVENIGYDMDKGRQDVSEHPFTISMSPRDVRITTRTNPDYLPMAVYASIHECGHALYEQGITPEFERTPLCGGASLGIHESQSRFWENIIGRSRPFCDYLLGLLKEFFPSRFENVSAGELYLAVNRAQPSLVRVEADEVTYNLHVLLRYEMENLLLENVIMPEEAPSVWNDKMEEYFGIRPRNDSEGILQDIHWSMGTFGYFPTYTIGNLVSVQIHEKMREDIPDMDRLVSSGNFRPVLGWLREKIHVHGAKYEPKELLEKSLGIKLEAGPFLKYLNAKYGEIYELQREEI